MIWEADPIARTAEKLLEMGIDSAVVAPGAGRPGVGDYLSVMEANAAAIERVFSSP
jgi:hypothetical protein